LSVEVGLRLSGFDSDVAVLLRRFAGQVMGWNLVLKATKPRAH